MSLEIPTKERILEMLEKVEKALPNVKEKIKKGIGEKLENEGMIVVSALTEDVISVGIKEGNIVIRVL